MARWWAGWGGTDAGVFVQRHWTRSPPRRASTERVGARWGGASAGVELGRNRAGSPPGPRVSVGRVRWGGTDAGICVFEIQGTIARPASQDRVGRHGCVSSGLEREGRFATRVANSSGGGTGAGGVV